MSIRVAVSLTTIQRGRAGYEMIYNQLYNKLSSTRILIGSQP